MDRLSVLRKEWDARVSRARATIEAEKRREARLFSAPPAFTRAYLRLVERGVEA